MVALLVIIAGCLLIAAAGFCLWMSGVGRCGRRTEENWMRIGPGVILLFVFVIVALVFGITWGTTYLDSYNRVQGLSAFQNETMSAYQYTVDRTESVVIDASKTRDSSFTDFSYQQQGQAVSARIVEMRNEIAAYNRQLYDLRGKNRLPVIGAMYKDVPEDLKPIKLGSLPEP